MAYGGQAVLQGVMMRGPAGMAVAVRRGTGGIDVLSVPRPLAGPGSPWRWPFLRGWAALADSLILGAHALMLSAALLAADDDSGHPPAAVNPSGDASGAVPKLGTGGAVSLVVSACFGIGLFILLPAVVAGRLRPVLSSAVVGGLVEGLLRLVLLLGYVAGIAWIPDVRRVLQYHGAEHKAIAALESGLPLEVDTATARSRFHPRCGTSFLLYVVLLAGFAFALAGAVLGWQGWWPRLILRLALVPVLACLGYEILRLTARAEGTWAAFLVEPGLWLQRLTTHEPDAAQVEVALLALRRVLVDGRGGLTPPRAG